MSITGLGQDGSIKVQKEAVYKTPLTASQAFLPWVQGVIKHVVEQIEVQNMIGSRIQQDPVAGRKSVKSDEVVLEIPADLAGLYLELGLGALVTVTDTPVAGANTHTGLIPIDGENCGASWTVEQFIGADTGEQFAGVKCIGFKIAWDNQGTTKFHLMLVGVDLNENAVTRPTTIIVSATEKMKFCGVTVQITPSGVTQFAQLTNSGEINVNFGYIDEGQRYKASACTAQAPIFGTIPTVTITINIDAEKRFETWAQEQKSFKVDISMLTAGFIAGTTPYKLSCEAPAMILEAETNRDAQNDNISLDLNFNVATGGTTTGSGTDVVQAEFVIVDDVASYTG